MMALNDWMEQQYGAEWKVKDLGRDRSRTIKIDGRRIVEETWQGVRGPLGDVIEWQPLNQITRDYLPTHLTIIEVPHVFHVNAPPYGPLQFLATMEEFQRLQNYQERIVDEIASYKALMAELEETGL